MEVNELMGDVVAKAAAYTCHFEGVGETVVDEDAARQWKDLCLVLEASEGGGEDETVVVAFELGTVVFAADVQVFLPKPFIRDKLKPIHGAKVRKKGKKGK